MSKQEQHGWDERYRSGDHASPLPDPFLQRLDDGTISLPSERAALDLACGSGRHAIWLAQHGWDVYGCDLSQEGLRIAAARARSESLNLKLFCAEIG